MQSLTKAALVLVAVAAVAAGCGGSSVVPNGPVKLDDLRKQSVVPVFYLGDSYRGMKVSYADALHNDRVLITYGTCKAPSGGNCSPPLEIQTCKDSSAVNMLGKKMLAEQASSDLRPLNDAARKLKHPHLKINQGLRCG